MDGGEITETSEGGGGSPAPLYPYSELFRKLFPYYLSIGMTYEQYWLGEVELVGYYRQAAKIKRDLVNHDAWLQGMYFYEALCDASPLFRTNLSKKTIKATPYREKPYDFSPPKEEKKKDSKGLAFMKSFMEKHNKKFQRKEEQNG